MLKIALQMKKKEKKSGSCHAVFFVCFQIKGDYKKTAAKNLQIFKYLTLLAVHKATGVSPLRITNINVSC